MSDERQAAEIIFKELNFGDYCLIEQKRYGMPNEMYLHKVIGRLGSSHYVQVPVDLGPGGTGLDEVWHDAVDPVLLCICCGVCETEVRKYRESDCKPTKKGVWLNE